MSTALPLAPADPSPPEGDRVALTKEALKQAFVDNLYYIQGKFPTLATKQDYYLALAYTVRDRMMQRWISTAAAYTAAGSRTVAYLSAEFLMGPHLANNLLNLGIHDVVRQAVTELGLSLDELLSQEDEPGLGNGGLGRLAACFIDSLATLQVPCLGYGIRYEHGIFQQEIVNGWQVEKTDKWLRHGNPWEIARPEWAVEVKFGGHTERYTDGRGRLRVRWVPERTVSAVPYDTPILGYRVHTANTLRLWRAEAPESFDFSVFNRGDYWGAVQQKVTSENISKVLYPNDERLQGKALRLEQQYFFVCASLQDMLRIIRVQNIPPEYFHEKFAVQLNDTHPSIAIAELMRLLVDDLVIDWDRAWSITRATFGYTNHTLMPEALETWPVRLFGNLLPRHLEIIYEINARFLEEVRIAFFGDEQRLARMSLIDERDERSVRMAHLATVGSHAVNGVARLHSELLERNLLRDFHDLWPEKFSNKTNGVTPRRWIALANPRLARCITHAIGERWLLDLEQLGGLEPLVEDADFRAHWRDIKRSNKVALASMIRERTGVVVDPQAMFDVQVKRIHEYKRQHLNILHVIGLYHRLKNDPHLQLEPRVFIFGGKAAPGYELAKLMIHLITAVGATLDRDPAVRELLKVVFLPNFNVTSAQCIYPAADLSEQISTAGKEASGTGNMKFQMNGALTIGTLDGANIEIREAVGAENFFLFGLSAGQAQRLLADGYHPLELYRTNSELREVLDLIRDGFFSRGDGSLLRPLVDHLLHHDPYLVLADYAAYAQCQQRVDAAYRDTEQWTRQSILNTARSGRFSSDRSIREYCADIWRVERVPIDLTQLEHMQAGLMQ
ncbi:MAG TPA: glycogen/starch/alpha-glucan phosphorylase [Steroidobacteraceae bacterium]|nr:glycogen/starch/alpha-glucan phosphorylase [Steroidobacteraceae bacterium]